MAKYLFYSTKRGHRGERKTSGAHIGNNLDAAQITLTIIKKFRVGCFNYIFKIIQTKQFEYLFFI